MTFCVLKLEPGLARGETEFSIVERTPPGEPERCGSCGRNISLLRWLPPYVVELETWDRFFGDIAFGPGNDLLVSERFRDLWSRNELVGLLGFEPVEIVGVKRHKKCDRDPPPYYRVSAVRSASVIDQEASGFEWESEVICPACRKDGILKRWKRVVFETSTWSGENVFRAFGLTGTFFADERFREFFAEHKVSSAHLIDAEEYGHDFYPEE